MKMGDRLLNWLQYEIIQKLCLKSNGVPLVYSDVRYREKSLDFMITDHENTSVCVHVCMCMGVDLIC